MDSDPRPGRLSEEDRALIWRIAGQLGQLIHGMPADLPDLQRRDELGILANMVSRLARDLAHARASDAARQAELLRRVAELQSAYETQEKLLGQVRELSYPILALHPEVLLVHVSGALAVARCGEIVEPVFRRLAVTRARSVILDIARIEAFDDEAARALVQTERALSSRGVVTVVAGVPDFAEQATALDLSRLNPCTDLAQALATALDLAGYRIVR